MATRTPLDKQIMSVLKYDVSRPYLGEFKFSDLYSAQGSMRRSEYYDESGARNMRVYVGKINGDVICGALWRLMEYNPGRFFTNPFLYNGKMDIYRFVFDTRLPADTIAADVIAGVRGKLREYLSANAQWRDEIQTTDGFVYTVLKDGHTGPMYKKLCFLRDAIKIVTARNCADFDAKHKPYREFIIRAVGRLHPDMFVQKTNPVPAPTIIAPDYNTDEDRIYDQMEHLQITLDNKNSVSPELYEQACTDMAKLMRKLHDIRSVHTL